MAIVIAAAVSALAQETNRINPRDFSAFQLITQRNIFDPSRRGPLRTGPARDPVYSFSFTGTLSYFGKGPYAVFDGTSSEYHKILLRGGKIAGYTVTNIAPDFVDLVQDTNWIHLRVGMQMRRDTSGKWYTGESAGSYNSFASYSSRRNYDRNDRRTSYRRNDRNGSRYESRYQGSSSAETSVNTQPDMPPPDMNSGAPPDAGNGAALDPVTRMMLRRQQETGGNADASTDTNGNGPTSDQGGNTPGSDGQAPNQPGPDSGTPDQPAPPPPNNQNAPPNNQNPVSNGPVSNGNDNTPNQ